MIQQNWKNQNEGNFELVEEGARLGLMELLLTDSGRLVIKHTEVDPQHGGKGKGKKLLEAVVDFAREKNYRILPICPFAKNLMMRDPERYQEIMIG